MSSITRQCRKNPFHFIETNWLMDMQSFSSIVESRRNIQKWTSHCKKKRNWSLCGVRFCDILCKSLASHLAQYLLLCGNICNKTKCCDMFVHFWQSTHSVDSTGILIEIDSACNHVRVEIITGLKSVWFPH